MFLSSSYQSAGGALRFGDAERTSEGAVRFIAIADEQANPRSRVVLVSVKAA